MFNYLNLNEMLLSRLKILFGLLVLPSMSYANGAGTVDESLFSILQSMGATTLAVLAFSFLFGLIVIVNGVYKLIDLGKDERATQTRTYGVVIQFLMGIVCVSPLTILLLFGTTMFGHGEDTNFYQKAITEKTINPAKKKNFDSKCNTSSCSDY